MLRYSIQSYGEDRSRYDCVAFIEEANCDGTWVTDSCARGGEDATGAAMSYSYSYSYGGSSASRRRRLLAGSYSYSYSAETATGADHTVEYAEQTFGLCAGTVEGQLEIVGGSRTVDLGRTIDWREFHHFCLTYDGPSRGGNSDLTFYFDGDKPVAENVLLDTAPEGTAMRLGTDATYDRPLTGALDEAYIYASALDASAIEVLYGSVSAAPTVTPVPTSHLFEGSLVAYYPFVDGTTQDAHHTWNGYPESMTTTEGRDGSTAIVLDADHGDSVWLPWEVVQDLDGDADRTVCLWARIDEWNGGYLFHYGGSSDPGSYAPTLQETYEPTVEETAAPSKPSSAPTRWPTWPRDVG